MAKDKKAEGKKPTEEKPKEKKKGKGPNFVEPKPRKHAWKHKEEFKVAKGKPEQRKEILKTRRKEQKAAEKKRIEKKIAANEEAEKKIAEEHAKRPQTVPQLRHVRKDIVRAIKYKLAKQREKELSKKAGKKIILVKRKRPVKEGIGVDVNRIYSEKKRKYFERANSVFDQFDKALVVECDNVQSKQMQNIRTALRGKAVLLMGKNTQVRRILAERAKSGNPREKTLYQKLITDGLMSHNVGLLMTNDDLREIKRVVDENKVQAPARQGAIAPLDVIVPAGITGLEPTKTSFFQALNIGTKITKGTVEILKDEKVITKGDKVGSSEATLLQMLNIKPFFYGLIVNKCYDQGSVYGPEVLSLTDEDMKKKFEAGITRVTAFSLGSGFTTKLSIAHVLANAFKKALAVTIATDYTSTKQKDLKEAILSGNVAPAQTAAPVAEDKPKDKAPEAKKKEAEPEPEEEDGDMGFGLFD